MGSEKAKDSDSEMATDSDSEMATDSGLDWDWG